MKNVLLVSVFLIFSSFLFPLKAQFSILGGLEYNIMGEKKMGMPAVCIAGMAESYDNIIALYLKASYALPDKFNEIMGLSSYTGSYINYSVEGKLSFFSFTAGLRWYLKEGNATDGGFYAAGGMSYLMGKINYTYPPYDRNAYYLYPEDSLASGTFRDIKLFVGGGIDVIVKENLYIAPELSFSTYFYAAFGQNGPVKSPVKYYLTPSLTLRYVFPQ